MDVLAQLLDGQHLDETSAYEMLTVFTDEAVSPAYKGALLTALRAKGETAAEVRGLALAMRDAAITVDTGGNTPVIDTCGTGGDGSDSFNISTTAALLIASCGVRVAKHGNRSVSSRSGSADVLDALGIPVATDPISARHQLDTHSFVFLFAPRFHPATKAVVPIRQALKTRTVFNILGPLANPARPSHQIVGAFSEHAATLMAQALAGMGLDRAFVVHGAEGWDEATPVGPFLRFDVAGGNVRRETIDPQITYGIGRCSPTDLAGGDATHNATITRAVLSGERGPHRDVVLLNAALALEMIGMAAGHDAVAAAAAAIDDGRALALLDRLSKGVV